MDMPPKQERSVSAERDCSYESLPGRFEEKVYQAKLD